MMGFYLFKILICNYIELYFLKLIEEKFHFILRAY